MPQQPQVHPELDALRTAFTERQLRCPSGVVEVDASSLTLYYGKSQSAPRRLDFVNASEDDLKNLADSCAPAIFGRNQEDVHDETYRRAGVLDTAEFAIGFDPVSSGVIGSIEDLLLEGHKRSDVRLVHELYKLNVYGPGQFFKAHKDTPRAENMIASLVVVLPTSHEGGKLELKHEGHASTFDSASLLSKASKRSIAFTAFFGDVMHEVTPVTAGYRVTLTYNLYLNDIASTVSPSCDAQRSALQTALTEVIDNPAYLPEGGYIGFALRHEYALDASQKYAASAIKPFLKGSDAILAALSESLGLETSIWVAYEARWDDGLILCDSKVEMPDYELEDGWESVLLQDHGGMRVNKNRNSRRSLRVQWATEIKSAQVSFTEGYIAYGNEASLSYLYGRLCLLVRLGPTGNRQSPPLVSDSDNDDDNYYY